MSFAHLQCRKRLESDDIQNLLPTVRPIVTDQGLMRIAPADFLKSLGFRIEFRKHFRHVTAIRLSFYDRVGPVEQLTKCWRTRRASDHHRTRCRPFKKPSTHLRLAASLVRAIHLCRKRDEVAAALGDVCHQIAMCPMISRLDQQAGNRVINIKQPLSLSHAQQNLVHCVGPPSHAVDIDRSKRRVRIRRKPQNISSQRDMMARTANEILHSMDRAAETKENMIEMLQQPKMEPIFLKPARIKLRDETDFDLAPFFPASNAIQIEEVGRVHTYEDERLIVLLKRD